MKDPPTRTQASAARRAPRVVVAFMAATLGSSAVRIKVHSHDSIGDQFRRAADTVRRDAAGDGSHGAGGTRREVVLDRSHGADGTHGPAVRERPGPADRTHNKSARRRPHQADQAHNKPIGERPGQADRAPNRPARRRPQQVGAVRSHAWGHADGRWTRRGREAPRDAVRRRSELGEAFRRRFPGRRSHRTGDSPYDALHSRRSPPCPLPRLGVAAACRVGACTRAGAFAASGAA